MISPRFARLLDVKIPGSKMVVVEKVGHYMAMENPEVINSEIINFLEGLGYR